MYEEHESVKGTILRIVITIILLIITYFMPTTVYPKILMYAIPYLVIGWEMFADTYEKLVHRKFGFDEELLMTLATLGAFAVGEYAEASAVLIFYEIGELFEHLASEKSRKSVAELMKLRPERVTLLRNGEPVDLPPDCVEIGDIIRVTAGEIIPRRDPRRRNHRADRRADG